MPECPLCGDSNARRIFRKGNYDYHKCKRCSHTFVFPLPSDLETRQHYEKSYSPEYLKANIPWFEVLAQKRMQIIQDLYSDSFKGSLLDAGSGFGIFLKEARSHGWETLGIDSAGFPLSFSRQQLGLKIVEGDVNDILQALPDECFDVVSFWHTLEHVEAPKDVLKSAIGCLSPGGYLIVNSPNLDSAIFRLVGKRWGWIYTPGHLQYFSLFSLCKWFEERGLQVVRRETWSDAPNLYFLVLEALLLSCSGFLYKFRLSLLGERLRGFVYGQSFQVVIQLKLKTLYYATPLLDRYLLKKKLGHEFLILARKPKPSYS